MSHHAHFPHHAPLGLVGIVLTFLAKAHRRWRDGAVLLVANERWWGSKPITARVTVWPRSIEIQDRLAEVAIRRYQRGLISTGDRDQDRIRALTARRNRSEAMRSYLKTYLEYLVAVGRSPEEQS